MINHNEWLIVGLLTSPHGIHGKIKVKSLSDFDERFTKPGKRWIQKENETPREFELISGFKKPGKEFFIIAFRGINNRNEAEILKGCKILVKVDTIPELNKEEYHLTELLNLEVKISEQELVLIEGNNLECDIPSELKFKYNLSQLEKKNYASVEIFPYIIFIYKKKII